MCLRILAVEERTPFRESERLVHGGQASFYNARVQKYYYWMVAGIVGFLYAQGVIVMWPEWSAWTWWGLATLMLPLFAVPTLYDKWQAREKGAAWLAMTKEVREWATNLKWAMKFTLVIALLFVLLSAMASLLRIIRGLFP